MTSNSSLQPTREAVVAWLAQHHRIVSKVVRSAVMLHGAQGMLLAAASPPDATMPVELVNAGLAAASRVQPVIEPLHGEAGDARWVVAHPLHWSGAVLGAAVLLLDRREPPSEAELGALQRSAIAFLRPAALENNERRSHRSQAVLRVLQDAGAWSRASDAATSIATSLAASLDCDRVSIGVRRGEVLDVIGSSDGWHTQSSALRTDVAAAMDEALDEGAIVRYPPPPDDAAALIAAHAHLSNKREARALCSVPLITADGLLGAVLAERAHAREFTADDVALLQEAGRTVAPWLSMRRQLDMHWVADLRRRMKTSFSSARSGRFRLAFVSGALAVAVLLGWPIEREIRAPVKLEGEIQRLITAPGDSYLQHVAARPGDLVRAGQVLVEFAVEELRLERQRLEAEQGAHQAAATEALAKQDLPTLAARSAKISEVRAHLALLDQKLAQARVVAPFDAVVIQGDLAHAIGAPAKKGDLLMTLAPADRFKAIVEIDDEDIGRVQPGQSGRLVLAALPHREIALQVVQIAPVAVAAAGRSFFEVEVALGGLATANEPLRPGMRGVARLAGGKAPRGVVWLEDASAWCRVAWWRWIG